MKVKIDKKYNDIIEKEWHNLIKEQHILKKNGYSKFEQAFMSAEERHEIIDLIMKDVEEQRNANRIHKK